MERHNDTIIIAVDHGYGNMKTANHCFPSGILVHEGEPTFPDNLLYYEGRLPSVRGTRSTGRTRPWIWTTICSCWPASQWS